jgi:tetratricopeptide (TPR) repeat protein
MSGADSVLILKLPRFASSFWHFGAFQELTRVISGHFTRTRIRAIVCSLAVIVALTSVRAQSQDAGVALQAVVQGYVHDASGSPVAGATVFLQLVTATDAYTTSAQTTQTDSAGAYRFVGLRAGAYTLRAEKKGYSESIVGPIDLASKGTKKVDLALVSSKTPELQGARPATTKGPPKTQAPEFFDEPQFTVAGVTSASNSGGHGSDTVLRTSEALARATVSLSKESAHNSSPAPSAAMESSLRDAVARKPEDFEANRQLGKFLINNGKASEAVLYLKRASLWNPGDAELHHLLGDADEKSANPLDAVREYQRAAELDPSETNLFDWGTELLTHRALEPATEVFTHGNRLFPKSGRMLVALGVCWYARGSYDRATEYLASASDLAPDNPTPYLFLGKMQSAGTTPSKESFERLARFAQLQPDNALANYYYAVALWKQSASAGDDARIESLLQKAVHFDAKLGPGYLKLGSLYSQHEDFPRAIAAYQKAIEVSTQPDDTLEEAHYRLAQAYERTGEKDKAQVELKQYKDLNLKLKEDRDHERREVQEFVISLQTGNSGAQP